MGLRTVVAGAAALALVTLALAAPWPAGGGGPAAPLMEAAPEPAASGVSGPSPPAPAGRIVHYDWPLSPEPAVVREFEPPEQVWAPGHRGVDLEAPGGAPVHAAGAGVVTFAGRVVDRTVVSIDHADGIRTTYEPLDPVVHVGQHVMAGEVIGHLDRGDTGPHCDTDCLHWGARTGPETYLDPLLLLRGKPVVIRLYPTGR